MPKVTVPLMRFVKARYLFLRDVAGDYRQRIMEEVSACFDVRLSKETLRKLFAEPPSSEPVGACRHEGSTNARPNELTDPCRLLGPCAVSIGCQASSSPGADGAGHDNHSTLSPVQTDPAVFPAPVVSEAADSPGHTEERHRECPSGVPGSGRMPPKGARLIHHVGQILFSACQDAITAFRSDAVGFQTQWIGQILQGAVNIEQSRLICAPSLSLFTGPVRPSPDEQRAALGAMADVDSVIDPYSEVDIDLDLLGEAP